MNSPSSGFILSLTFVNAPCKIALQRSLKVTPRTVPSSDCCLRREIRQDEKFLQATDSCVHRIPQTGTFVLGRQLIVQTEWHTECKIRRSLGDVRKPGEDSSIYPVTQRCLGSANLKPLCLHTDVCFTSDKQPLLFLSL